jgi:hypothetical protein
MPGRFHAHYTDIKVICFLKKIHPFKETCKSLFVIIKREWITYYNATDTIKTIKDPVAKRSLIIKYLTKIIRFLNILIHYFHKKGAFSLLKKRPRLLNNLT